MVCCKKSPLYLLASVKNDKRFHRLFYFSFNAGQQFYKARTCRRVMVRWLSVPEKFEEMKKKLRGKTIVIESILSSGNAEGILKRE